MERNTSILWMFLLGCGDASTPGSLLAVDSGAEASDIGDGVLSSSDQPSPNAPETAADAAAFVDAGHPQPLCDTTGRPAGPPGCPKGKALCIAWQGATAVTGCNSLGCWNVSPCPADGPCIDGGSAGVGCVSGIGTCDGLYAMFDALVSPEHNPCGTDADCHHLDAACTAGLGHWKLAVNTGVTQAQITALAARAKALGCTQYTCNAAAPSPSVQCKSGTCAEKW